jgi:diguanylate cyclase (GGDEF)-like protein
MYPVQLALFGAEALVMALLVFGAFRNRAQFGRAPLYVVLGGGLCLAAFASWRVEVAPGWAVQPASAVLVGATLAAVLLVYVVEGARQTRTVVHALALGNAGLTLLALIVGQHLRIPGSQVPVTLSSDMLLRDALLALAHATVLYFLLIGLVLVYEFVSRYVSALFVRAFAALAAVASLDALLFTAIGDWTRPDLPRLVTAHVLAGLTAALVQAALVRGYVAWVEPATADSTGTGDVSDVLHELTYRQLYEQARSRLTRDALTGVHNRGYFDEAFTRAVAHATRYQEHLSVLIADADHFKTINDRHSHLVGDEVLKKFAGTLVDVARSSDVVCRYGGDEFVVILPNTPLASAQAFAQRFQRRLREQAVAPAPGAPPLVLSSTIGVASLLEDGVGPLPEDLLRLADNRLYVGKRAGRDRVVWQDLPVSEVSSAVP